LAGSAFVAVLVVDLHFPEARSLKDRRRELAPVKTFLTRQGAAVSEVGHHDVWQRAQLLCALTGGSAGRLHDTADSLERWLDARFPFGASLTRSLYSLEDLSERP
jgi:uncharacterized protein YlxP (DUF503 family)